MHFGHVNIRDYCPARQALGSDVAAMNEQLIERWNETVMPSDLVTIVGDLVMGRKKETLPLVARLNGRKYLLPGNHDLMFDRHGASRSRANVKYEQVGVRVLPYDAMYDTVDGHRVLVCHFPYAGDSTDKDRYVDQRPLDRGDVLLHGHVHDAWRTNGRQINVGVDVWDYRPVSEAALAELIRTMD